MREARGSCLFSNKRTLLGHQPAPPFVYLQGIHIWDGNGSREYLDSIGLSHR